jgi:transcriptional regulator with PAS, ATPase and Fis domain
MQSAAKRNADFPEVLTIEDGLNELLQVYTSREIKVARINLNRDGKTFQHVVDDTQPGVQRPIEGRYTGTTIIVSVLTPMPADVNADLQAVTTSAAAAAADWLEPSTDPLSQTSRMLGSSEQMTQLQQDITRAGRSEHIVLITGESGTGKTTAAQMIHDRSRRASQPFIDVNCAAFPDTLIESELFGYEKGAFTGAAGQKKGLFELADEGTLFLDEIGELKLELQAKLLKAIEQQKIRRLGGTKDIVCDVRIIAASSRILQRMVREGTFREDLYYRLDVLEVSIAPLRERPGDIRALVAQRLIIEQKDAGLSGPVQIEEEAFVELLDYRWPGNIRQLHNVLARIVNSADHGQPITAADVRQQLDRFCDLSTENVTLPETCRTIFPGESLEDFSARVRIAAIEATKEKTGNMARTAQRLKVDRSSLLKILRRLNNKAERPEKADRALAA